MPESGSPPTAVPAGAPETKRDATDSTRVHPLAEIRGTLRRLGWRAGLVNLAARALARASGRRARIHHYRFVAQAVPPAPARRAAASASMSIVRVGPDDPIVAQFPRPAHVIARRFARGAVCFVARAGDRFAGFIWLQHDRYEEDEVRCDYLPTPADRAVWDFDVYVEPAYRMGRTFTRLWDAANDYLRERGVEWSFSRIAAANIASLRAHARFGLEDAGSAIFVCAGRLQLALLPMRPYVHLSSGRSVPVLRFRVPERAR